MGQKTSKIEEKELDLSEAELAKYRRIVAKYEQRKSKNEEYKNRRERMKSKKFKKPESIAEISDQVTIFKYINLIILKISFNPPVNVLHGG